MSTLVSSIADGLRRAGFVFLIGAVAGLAVYVSGPGGFEFSSWSPVVLGNSVLVGVLYVAVIDAVTRIIQIVMEAFVPVQSEGDIVLHALAPAGGTLLIFLGLTAGLKALLGTDFPTSWILLLGIGTGAALLVGGSTGVQALQSYYRRDRQDHAEGWEARMRRLRTQCCPPVLFETLDLAQTLLDQKPEAARPLLHQLQALLTYRRQAAGDELVPLSDEIEAALWYVELVQMQFGDDLEVGFDVPDSLLSVPVPRLTLIPLLENAVEHGAGKLNEPCTITITGRHDDDRLCLAVLDTGPGFDTTDPDTVLRRGSGIADLYARLRSHFGNKAELSLLPQGVLWCAPITDSTPASPPTDAPASRTTPSAPSD